MRRTSPRKPLSTSNISPSYPISITPPVLENGTPPPPPPNYIYRLIHKIIFSLATPNYPHCLPLHISIILLFLMILIVTIPLMIPPYTMYGNQPKLTLVSLFIVLASRLVTLFIF